MDSEVERSHNTQFIDYFGSIHNDLQLDGMSCPAVVAANWRQKQLPLTRPANWMANNWTQKKKNC
jgi:hypothetical protein